MRSLEQALTDAEGAAETARKSAARVVSQARALVKAARTGNIAAIKRCQASLEELAGALEDDVMNACSCWPFTDDEEQRLFEEDYAGLLRDVADARGLKIHERDGLMIAYPSILRVLASERAVRVDRKKVSTINPSYLVDLLLANQKKSSGFKPHQFLESLYSVYTELLEAKSGDLVQGGSGRVVPLARIYRLITALPGAARDYDRSDFARDLYILESEGPHTTRKGAEVSFPSSTGTKRRSADLFSFVGPQGDSVEYYGIRFSGAEQ